MRKFRNKHPQRTYMGSPKKHYRDYHAELITDFNGRCAYTDCQMKWWGDGMHIDHFAPRKPTLADKSKAQAFVKLEHVYSNLVYACPQINRAKGNDWPSEDPAKPRVGNRGYIDPCSDFNKYFARQDGGSIVPKDHPVAKYMWQKLKLYLIRYELYWRMEQIEDRQDELLRLSDLPSLPNAIRRDVEKAIVDLTREYRKYSQYLQADHRSIIR